MAVKGTVIAESIRIGSALDGIALTVQRIRRSAPDNISPEQLAAGISPTWTMVEFEVEDADAGPLAEALAAALDDAGWYVDFHSANETFVVFSGHVFRYPRGDAAGRAEAQAYARTRGVPESQLDWPD